MATYYIEVGSGESGDGSLSDPFHIDSQADLDNILNGGYAGSTASASGDIYIFLDGTYASGLRINADGHDGLTFRSLNTFGAYFANVNLGPQGDTTGNILTRSSESTTFEKLHFEISTYFKAGGGTLTLTLCKVDSSSTPGGYGTFQMGGYAPGGVFDKWLPTNLYFDRCLIINNSSSHELFNRRATNHTITNAKDHPDNLSFSKCTIVGKSTQPIFEGGSGSTITIQMNNSIVYGEAGTTTDNTSYETFSNSANNWGYRFGNSNLPSIGSTDPLFEDTTTDNYRLKPNSPCIGMSTVS